MLFDQRVPMRDGATLSADVTLPAAALEQGERVPVILMRTPYVKSNILTVTAARYYAERGYAYVAMDVRGRGDSDGVFVPSCQRRHTTATTPSSGWLRSPGRTGMSARSAARIPAASSG